MRLLPIPDASGEPVIWINADHLVSVQRITAGAAEGRQLYAEVKVDGMPLQRVSLGTFLEQSAADEAWAVFLQRLQDDQ